MCLCDTIERERERENEKIIEREGESDGVSMLSLPFEPITMTFSNISYSVPRSKQDKDELMLLLDISGYFEPGTMTALMGATGAGKTTLLDVLSARKNTGSIIGEIRVNGRLIDSTCKIQLKSIMVSECMYVCH